MHGAVVVVDDDDRKQMMKRDQKWYGFFSRNRRACAMDALDVPPPYLEEDMEMGGGFCTTVQLRRQKRAFLMTAMICAFLFSFVCGSFLYMDNHQNNNNNCNIATDAPTTQDNDELSNLNRKMASSFSRLTTSDSQDDSIADGGTNGVVGGKDNNETTTTTDGREVISTHDDDDDGVNDDLVFISSQPPPNGCTTTLLLIRHCEKLGLTTDENGNEHCSYLGFQRADYLATLFEDPKEEDHDENNQVNDDDKKMMMMKKRMMARYPTPSYLFALTTERKRHSNYREFETLIPLSRKIHVNVTMAEHPDFAKDFLNLLYREGGNMCNKTSVVVWKHSYITELANALGCGKKEGCPTKYPEDDYDQFWELQYVYNAPIHERYATEETLAQYSNGEVKNQKKRHVKNKRKHHHHHNHRRGSEQQQKEQEQPCERYLKKAKDDDDYDDQDSNLVSSSDGWTVYGTRSYQHFDPVAFGKFGMEDEKDDDYHGDEI